MFSNTMIKKLVSRFVSTLCFVPRVFPFCFTALTSLFITRVFSSKSQPSAPTTSELPLSPSTSLSSEPPVVSEYPLSALSPVSSHSDEQCPVSTSERPSSSSRLRSTTFVRNITLLYTPQISLVFVVSVILTICLLKEY